MDMTKLVRECQNAPDHKALAKHYEDAAKEMQQKVRSTKRHSKNMRPHLYYGKQAQELKAHCRGLIRIYEQASEANMSMAKFTVN